MSMSATAQQHLSEFGVEARVELVNVDGRTLTFQVTLSDNEGPIGEGLHKRAVIDQAKFIDRVAAKTERVFS